MQKLISFMFKCTHHCQLGCWQHLGEAVARLLEPLKQKEKKYLLVMIVSGCHYNHFTVIVKLRLDFVYVYCIEAVNLIEYILLLQSQRFVIFAGRIIISSAAPNRRCDIKSRICCPVTRPRSGHLFSQEMERRRKKEGGKKIQQNKSSFAKRIEIAIFRPGKLHDT